MSGRLARLRLARPGRHFRSRRPRASGSSMRAGRTPPASSRRRPLRGAPPSPASWKPPDDDPPWGGTHAATSAEGVRATARVLDEQLAELRDALARLTSADDLARDGEPRVAPGNGNPRAGSAGARERSERVMRATRRADAMVKRAAATVAAHRKRVGGSTNPRADEACATALEELREASVELQRVHEKESAASDARELGASSSARDDEPGTRPEPRDDRRRFGSDGRFGSRLRLRADVEPLLDAIERSVRRLRRDAKHVAAALTREAKDGGGKGARRFPGFRSTRDSDGEDDGGASDVASEIFASSERSPPGAGGHEEASPKKQRSPLPSPLAQRWPPPSNPDPALVRELRIATETKERLARELDRASRASAATAEASKRRDADAAVARAALEASHAEALRQARREAARWRAMYDAAKRDAARGGRRGGGGAARGDARGGAPPPPRARASRRGARERARVPPPVPRRRRAPRRGPRARPGALGAPRARARGAKARRARGEREARGGQRRAQGVGEPVGSGDRRRRGGRQGRGRARRGGDRGRGGEVQGGAQGAARRGAEVGGGGERLEDRRRRARRRGGEGGERRRAGGDREARARARRREANRDRGEREGGGGRDEERDRGGGGGVRSGGSRTRASGVRGGGRERV